MIRISALGLALLVLLASPAPGLEAGAAKARLTVPPGTPLGGYPERMGRESLGEHDGLWSRCLYLDDSANQAWLVSVDLSHVPRALRDRVVDLAAAFAPKEQIFLCATGTRNGAGGMDQSLLMRWSSGRYQPETLEIVAQAIVATMETARDQKRRATLGYATAKQQALSQNRFVPDGTVDEQIGVVRVDDADGKAISVLVSLSARPELVPELHRYHLSADFPGAFYRFMEEQTTPDCVAIFLPGATADQTPGNPESLEGWERVDSIGRLLALRAKEASNDMTFRDVTVKTAYLEAPLPRSLAQAALPQASIFQALEVEGLQMLFVPGEPAAAVGLALRGDALTAGKSAQITVGMANEHIGAFLSREGYGDPRYLPAASPFGPDVVQWLRAQAAVLSTGEAPADTETFPALKPQAATGSYALPLRGPGYARGFQRAQLLRDSITARFNERVLIPAHEGRLRPAGLLWGFWPPMLDAAPVALPHLGMEMRPMLQALEDDLLAELEGYAAGAQLPFDGALLVQPNGEIAPPDDAPQAATLSGTQFAVTGERAAGETILVGCNFDWADAPVPIITSVEPEVGHNFLTFAFDWQLGALAGMNDAGLTLCLARNTNLGEPEFGSAAAALVIRRELQFTAGYDDAIARLRASNLLRGHQILVAGESRKGWRGAVLSFGKTVGFREVESGVLFGLDPESGAGDGAAQERYVQAAAGLGEETPIGKAEIQQVLALGVGGDGGPGLPWNGATRFSAVLLPTRLSVLAAFPGEQGAPGNYTEFRIKKAARNE